MKNLAKMVLLLILSSQAFGQQNVTEYNKPFWQINKEKQEEIRRLVGRDGNDILDEEGGAYRNYTRWFDFWAPRIAPDSSYASYNKNLRDYYDRHQPLDVGPPPPVVNNDAWHELGPFAKPNSGSPTIGIGGERGVGIIRSIAINRQNASKLLANSTAGGLFFSADKGKTWTNARSDAWFRSGCSAAAFAPDNENTWYAGSNVGGQYDYPESMFIGSVGGVYRTMDAGLTWSIIADRTTFNPGSPITGEATAISKLLIDPKHPNIGYLGTNIGLWKSENINTQTPTSVTWWLAHDGAIEDVEFTTDTSPISTVIISYKDVNGNWDIAKSVNGGVNWASLPNQPSHVGTTQIVIEVSDAAPTSLYVLDRKASAGIWIFDLGGSNAWTPKAQGIANEIGLGHCFGVSNFDPQIMYVGYGSVFLAKSINGGMTFTEPVALRPYYHNDVEDIVTPFASCTSCSHEVYVATHGGVDYSSDDLATLVNRSDGLGLAKCFGGGSGSQEHPERIVIGVDHDGSILSGGSYGSFPLSWETVAGGDGASALIDYSNGDYVWVDYQRSVPLLSSSGGHYNTYTYTSFGGFNDWWDLVKQNQISPEVVYCKAATNSNGLYEDLFRSNTRGSGYASIQRISNFQGTNLLPPDHYIFGIYPAPSDGNVLYVSEDTNTDWTSRFFQNTDIMNPNPNYVQTQWRELDFPEATRHGSTAVDLYNPNIVYFSYGGNSWSDPRFYRTDYTDPNNPVSINFAGAPAQGGLPNTVVNVEALERGSNGGIYAATDLGVFYTNNSLIDSTNGVNTKWIRLGSALPNIPISGVDINYTINKIRVYTSGRGVWEHDLSCADDASLKLIGAETTSTFHEARYWITSSAVVAPSVNITYRGGTYVQMDNGFIATPDSSNFVYAYIHPCDHSGNSPGL
jgi:hypothetical protein